MPHCANSISAVIFAVVLARDLQVPVGDHRHDAAATRKIQLKKMAKPSTVTEPWKPVSSLIPLEASQACCRYSP